MNTQLMRDSKGPAEQLRGPREFAWICNNYAILFSIAGQLQGQKSDRERARARSPVLDVDNFVKKEGAS